MELIKTITRAIPEPIADIGRELIGKKCYGVLISDVRFLEWPVSDEVVLCMKLAISKAIGLGIVVASSIIKVPQLMKLVNARSGAGLSFTGNALECGSYLASFAYAARNGFAFSTYGEQAFLFIQDVGVMFLLLMYSNNTLTSFAVIPIVAAITWYAVISVPGPSAGVLALLQAATIPLGLAAKVPQIMSAYKTKSTGQLSAIAVFAYLGGSLARVFTTVQEVDDSIVLIGVLLGTVLNGIIALQMIIYWRK
ncbi:hypothetical protein V1512DRAFT_82889 [Lipomyces arxii]|uniref:uncharacterized protein n=1 Tax=Lipomyces arxii TaxID=56418 RepID=UPI0034CD646C